MRTLAEINHELQNGSPRTRFVIEGLLPVGLTVLYGATGSGKTGVAVRIAAAIAGGISDFGEVNVGSVLYVASEDRFGAEERLLAAAIHEHLSFSTAPIGIADAMSIGLAKSKSFILAEAERLSAATGYPIRAIIFDTYGTALGDLSQDDAQPATAATCTLEEVSRLLNCSVVVVHHSGKNSSDMRGSQVLADRADAVIRVSRGRSGIGEVKVEKMRNARTDARFTFEIGSQQLDTVGGKIDVQVVQTIRRTESGKSEKANYQSDDQSSKPATHFDTAERCLRLLSTQTKSVTLDRWRDVTFASFGDMKEGAKRTAFSRVRKDLVSAGIIREKGDIVTLVVTEKHVTKHVTTDPHVTVTPDAPPIRGGRRVTDADIDLELGDLRLQIEEPRSAHG